MTIPKPQAPQSPADLAEQIERVLPIGFNLVHTKSGWYLKKFDSWTVQITSGMAEGRTGWRQIDHDKSLAALLDRLGREGTGNG